MQNQVQYHKNKMYKNNYLIKFHHNHFIRTTSMSSKNLIQRKYVLIYHLETSEN